MQNKLKDKQCISVDYKRKEWECIIMYHKHRKLKCILSRINIIQLMY